MKQKIFKYLLLTGFLACSFFITSFQQDDAPKQWGKNPMIGWDRSIIDQANTGKNADYLTNDERRIILYTNMARLQPKKFGETFLDYYYKKNNLFVVTPQFTSLKEELSKAAPANALQPDKVLYDAAHSFAVKMGQEGKTGHEDFQNRMKEALTKYTKVGENCSYGDTGTMDCVVRLLIDDADPTRLQHRKNVLDPDFTSIGVSIQPHKVYKLNYVLEYGGKSDK